MLKVDELLVYQKLCELHLEIHKLTFTFPKFELYELGSQMRRSSGSPAANLAEGFDNKHTKIYLESISRGQGEIRETQHHLKVAHGNGYIDQQTLDRFLNSYDECGKMLRGLEKSLTHRL